MGNDTEFTTTTKYVVVARFEVEGVVEKPDVIGAIFGQTEGLFGPDLDLRELQKGGRVGRIEIELQSKQDHTTGAITVPTSLDKVSTAIIAAAIESVDRIGPCAAKVTLEKVEDVREEKRRVIMGKAKDILKRWVIERTPSSDEYVKEVGGVIRAGEVTGFGPDKLPAGPDVQESGSVIVVEGRADIVKLLSCGIKNAIAIEGTKIPQTVIDLCKNKEVTAFLDGDRGGDLILKELLQVAQIDYVARAPAGKEVEELTPKEIMKALRDKVPVEGGRGVIPPAQTMAPSTLGLPKIVIDEPVAQRAQELYGTLEAVLFDGSMKEIVRLPVSELAEKLPTFEGVSTVLFDGVVTQRLLDIAGEKKIKQVIGDRIAEGARRPPDVKVMVMAEVIRR